MAKSKKPEPDVARSVCDRYKPTYPTWEQFVIANFDKYPLMREQYLK
jgi:hypothetical protein